MTFLGAGSKHLIGHAFWLNGIVLMPHIDLPTADLGETHSLQKAHKPVAEVSFVLLSMFVSFVCFVRFVRFVEHNKPSKPYLSITFYWLCDMLNIS